MRGLIILVLLLSSIVDNAGIVSAKEIKVELEQTGYIFIGDSRTVGLNNICCISEDDNVWVVAKVGMGYTWLKDEAEDQIDRIVVDNPDITDWVLISNFGVNDLHNRKQYEDWYAGVADDFDLKVVSVNPTDGNYSYMSANIDSFNSKMQKFCSSNDVDYINTYDALEFDTVDGLHYNSSTYKRIKNYIYKEIGL